VLARLSLVAALAAAALGACAGGDPPAARQCPDDAPAACMGTAPRFSTDVAPLVATHCAKCHAPGGPAEKVPFGSYDEIASHAGDMMLELETCEMPPAPEPELDAAQRATLFAWITCGARND
jgi:hypothetical protein